MNLKLAKQLRRTAKALGIANKLPDRLMIEGKKHLTKIVIGKQKTIEGEETDVYFEYTGTDKNSPQSIRGIYRSMKKFNKETKVELNLKGKN